MVPGFAKLVTKARVAKNWSMNELARQADVSPMCISDLENMKRSPSLRVAAQITKALGLPIMLACPGALPTGFQLVKPKNPVGRKLYVRRKPVAPAKPIAV